MNPALHILVTCRIALLATTAAGVLLITPLAADASPPSHSLGDVWAEAFVDEFDGNAVDADQWTIRTGCQPFCTSADTVSVTSNGLQMTTRLADGDVLATELVGAHLESAEPFRDGYFEVVLQPPLASGLLTSAYLAPANADAAERLEIQLGDIFNAGASADGWTLRQRAFDWTPPTLAGAAPWIGGVTAAPAALPDMSTSPQTLGLYRTAAGDIAWYVNDALVAQQCFPLDVGANSPLALNLRFVAAALAGSAENANGAVLNVKSVRQYRPADTLTFYEPFAYSTGSIDAQSAGLGFSTPWSIEGEAFASGDGQSLAFPDATGTLGAGGRLTLNNASATRNLATGIKLSELNAYFFSALVKRPTGVAVRFELLDAAGNSRWKMGIDTAGRTISGIVTETAVAPSTSVDGCSVLIVGVMASRSGNVEDELRVKAYDRDAQIPATALEIGAFDAVRTQLSQVTLNKLKVTVTGGAAEVDELRFGPTLASVTTLRPMVGGCPAPPDYIDDDILDSLDAAAFLGHFDARRPAADINQDGSIDLRDFAEFSVVFSQGCSARTGGK